MIKDNVKYFFNYHVRFNPLFWKRFERIKDLKAKDYSIIKENQNNLFIHLFKRAYQKSEFYKKLYQQHGIQIQDIQSVEDIGKLPIITKQEIRDRVNDILIGSKYLVGKGLTSGTTGTPLKVYRDYDSILTEAAFSWAQRDVFGYLPGMKTVSMRGDLGRDTLYKHDPFSNTLFISSYNLKEEHATLYFNKISEFSPYAILAYPSSVYILATYFERLGKVLKVPYIFTSSETLYDFQRETIELVFNGKVVDWYGNAERSIAIEQLWDNKYYEIPLYSINEYQEDCTITTSLVNFSFPLIRYKVNDVIQPARESNNSIREIKKLTGRIDDILFLSDGTKIGRMDVVFKGVEHIEFAQFIQKSKETFSLNLVVNTNFNEKDEKKLLENLRDRLGEKADFKMNFVSEKDIIFTRANKYKLVINEVKEENEKINDSSSSFKI